MRGVAVIVEATYGVSSHQPREEREELFCARVRDIVQRGGRVLLPCVALGRAQVGCALPACPVAAAACAGVALLRTPATSCMGVGHAATSA